jgi:hypothetical protein
VPELGLNRLEITYCGPILINPNQRSSRVEANASFSAEGTRGEPNARIFPGLGIAARSDRRDAISEHAPIELVR